MDLEELKRRYGPLTLKAATLAVAIAHDTSEPDHRRVLARDLLEEANAQPPAMLELIAEVERLRADAMRYRLLRGYRPGLLLDMLTDSPQPNESYSDELDAAIDNALKGE